MGGVKLVLKHKPDSEELVFQFPASPYKEKLLQVLDKCDTKTNGFVSISIDRPYKPRTTGEGSQNNLFWVIATAIANETGDDVKDVEYDLKIRAIAKGYPYRVSKITGEPKPYSMKEINTVEMSYLIDTAYEVCAFLGIVLEPQYAKTEPTVSVAIKNTNEVEVNVPKEEQCLLSADFGNLEEQALAYAQDEENYQGDIF